jgi:hypothetical protein
MLPQKQQEVAAISRRCTGRSVGKDELKDIQGTGVYRAAPGGTEGKYFFPTRGQAEHFSSLMEKAGQGSPCITSGCISTSVLRGP